MEILPGGTEYCFPVPMTEWIACRRVQQAWREKLLLGGATGVVLTVAYRTLQQLEWRPVAMRAECVGWRWLEFDAAWVWPYVSMFVLVGVAWLSLPDARAVWRFAMTLLAVAAVGWVSFLLFPTGCVRPQIAGTPLAYRWLVALDGPTNCFPCLHSAFAVVAAATVGRSWSFSWPGRALLTVWVVVIAVSIVALRQHTDVDTLAGGALGLAGVWLDRCGAIKD